MPRTSVIWSYWTIYLFKHDTVIQARDLSKRFEYKTSGLRDGHQVVWRAETRWSKSRKEVSSMRCGIVREAL